MHSENYQSHFAVHVLSKCAYNRVYKVVATKLQLLKLHPQETRNVLMKRAITVLCTVGSYSINGEVLNNFFHDFRIGNQLNIS